MNFSFTNTRSTAISLIVVLICLLAPMEPGTSFAQTASPPTAATAPSNATRAFEKMQSLFGSWRGTVMGGSTDVTIRFASSRTAILHEATTTAAGAAPDHEITMFYLDGDRLFATHFCDAGNRSRMEGRLSPDGKTIEFSFLDVSGGTQKGYLKGLVIAVNDADHHSAELTFVLPNGNPIQARGEFQRLK